MALMPPEILNTPTRAAGWLALTLAFSLPAAEDPKSVKAVARPDATESSDKEGGVELARIRRDALAYAGALRVPDSPCGVYRMNDGLAPGLYALYASCDVAIMRTVMGEDADLPEAPQSGISVAP